MTLYSIDSTDYSYIQRVWDFAQYHSLPMYKARLGLGVISWVIELPEGKLRTRYLLEFAGLSTELSTCVE